jgi:hypothetical protein
MLGFTFLLCKVSAGGILQGVVSEIFQGFWGAVAPESKIPGPGLENFPAEPCILNAFSLLAPCMHVKIRKAPRGTSQTL